MYGVFDCSFYRVAEDLEVIAPLLKKHGIAGVSIPAHCLNSRGDALRARRLIEENGLRWGLMPTPVDMYAEQTDDNTFSDALHTLERWAENAQLAGVSRAYNHVHPGSNTRPFEQNFSWYRERIAAVQEIMKHFLRAGVRRPEASDRQLPLPLPARSARRQVPRRSGRSFRRHPV